MSDRTSPFRVVPRTRFGRITRPRLVLWGALGGLSLGLWLGVALRQDEGESEDIFRARAQRDELGGELHGEMCRRVKAEADVLELEEQVKELKARAADGEGMPEPWEPRPGDVGEEGGPEVLDETARPKGGVRRR